MLSFLLVGAGGFFGSILRYFVQTFLRVHVPTAFPLGTFVANIAGCFLMGMVLPAAARLSPQTLLFFATGFLGGFTTFSSFGGETVTLVRMARLDLAILNLTSNLVVGLIAVVVGGLVSKVLGFGEV